MKQVRSGNGSAGRFINDPALYNNANDIALQTARESLRTYVQVAALPVNF
jgi:hypothetical protein